MARALVEIMLVTHLGLCTWHLMENGIKHFGNSMKKGSHFLMDFRKCMYDYDSEVGFELAWSKLIIDYGVHENN